MKVIRSAEIQCDDCGRILRRQAAPHTPDLPFTRRRLKIDLIRLATDRHWLREGSSLLAGDLCPRCAANLRSGHT